MAPSAACPTRVLWRKSNSCTISLQQQPLVLSQPSTYVKQHNFLVEKIKILALQDSLGAKTMRIFFLKEYGVIVVD